MDCRWHKKVLRHKINNLIVIDAVFVFSASVFGVAALRKPAYQPNPIAYPRLLKWDLPYGFVVRAAVPRVVLRPVASLSVPDTSR